MRRNRLHAQTLHIVDGGAEADHLNNAGRARLKLVGRVVIGDEILLHLADHVAAAEERAHLRHPFLRHPDRAGGGGAVKLVAGDRIEIDAKVGDVHRHVDRALAAVDANRHAALPRRRRNGLHIHHGAGDVRHMCDRDQLGFRPDGVDHLLRIKRPVRFDIHPLQHRTLPLPQKMPGDDIRVMLQNAEDNLIPWLKSGHGPAMRHHVQPHGGAGGEDHFILIRRVQKPGDLAPYRLVILSRNAGQVMKPAMDVGIFLRIGLRHCVNHRLRFLG